MNFFNECRFLWDRLKSSHKPIVIYGTGDGADKLLDLCERFHIKISAIFASDGFVRDRTFRGYKVESYNNVCERFSDFIILLSFAVFKDDMYERMFELREHHEFYAPDMPLFGGDILTPDDVRERADEIRQAYDILADEQSKKVLECVLKYKITGEIQYLRECESDRDEIFKKLKLPKNPVYLDLGAYDGDTVYEFFERFPDCARAVAVEPDKANYKKLQSNLKKWNLPVRAVNKAVWSHFCELQFSMESSRNSHAGNGADTVLADSIDNIICTRADYIKMDVEGAERQALSGMTATMRDYNPSLCVSAYHQTCDFFTLVNEISEICPNHSIYLRHHKYIPAWETNAYSFRRVIYTD